MSRKLERVGRALILTAGVLAASAAMAKPPVTPVPTGVQQWSGYVEAFGGPGFQSYWADPYGGWPGLGGAARIAYQAGPGLSLQGDVFSDHFWVPDDSSYQYGSMGAALHISKREPGHLVGVFGGFDEVASYDGTEYGFGALFYGLEGQANMGRFGLYGQVGGMNSIFGTYQSADPIAEIFARVVGSFFINPNTKLEAGLTVLNGDVWAGDPDTTVIWKVKAEHKFNCPISAFVSVDGTHSSYVKGDGYDPVYRVLAGIKVAFGSDTLQDAAFNGAGLDTPDFSALGFNRNH